METVHTVADYTDGPRSGIADYCGRPHYFRCEWDAAANDYVRTYRLAEIDAETFAIALEQWQIWRRWELAFHSGQASADSHPGRGGRDARYDELERILQSRLGALPARVRVCAALHPAPDAPTLPVGVMRPLLVEWSPAA